MDQEQTHYATTAAADRVYRVYFDDELIIESEQAVILEEHHDGEDYPPVVYFPPADVAPLYAEKTGLSTHCPIKGDASYWSFREAVNGIWSYQDPLPQVEAIRGYFAFDQGKGFRVSAA